MLGSGLGNDALHGGRQQKSPTSHTKKIMKMTFDDHLFPKMLYLQGEMRANLVDFRCSMIVLNKGNNCYLGVVAPGKLLLT